jgi:predicted phage tail protein
VLRKIVLHGALKKEFGGPFLLDVNSPAEAFKALIVQLPGFRQRISAGNWHVVRGKTRTKGWDLEEEHLTFPLNHEPLHIVPAIAGSGKGGGLKIIIGVIIIAAAIVLSGGTMAAPLSGLTTTTAAGGTTLTVAGNFAVLGVGLVLTGVAMALSPTPKAASLDDRDKKGSFLFNNQQNVTAQGVPIPLVYGRVRVGSVVISASLETENISPVAAPEPPTPPATNYPKEPETVWQAPENN